MKDEVAEDKEKPKTQMKSSWGSRIKDGLSVLALLGAGVSIGLYWSRVPILEQSVQKLYTEVQAHSLALTSAVNSQGQTLTLLQKTIEEKNKLEERVGRLEQGGSFNFQRYMGVAEERDVSFKARLSTVELATAALPKIEGRLTAIEANQQADAKIIKDQLNRLQQQLDSHMERKP